MGATLQERRRRLVAVLVTVIVYLDAVTGVGLSLRSNVTATQCSGDLRCTSSNVTSTVYYYYVPEDRQCRKVPEGCVTTCSNFTVHEDCERSCHQIGGCASTRLGCCPDEETPMSQDGECPGEDEATSDSDSASMRWDLLVVGVAVAVILVGVVSIVGILSYSYRQRQKLRQRRYIQEVLQMYEDGSSDEGSDSSYVSDNPEKNNLFDQL